MFGDSADRLFQWGPLYEGLQVQHSKDCCFFFFSIWPAVRVVSIGKKCLGSLLCE